MHLAGRLFDGTYPVPYADEIEGVVWHEGDFSSESDQVPGAGGHRRNHHPPNTTAAEQVKSPIAVGWGRRARSCGWSAADHRR